MYAGYRTSSIAYCSGVSAMETAYKTGNHICLPGKQVAHNFEQLCLSLFACTLRVWQPMGFPGSWEYGRRPVASSDSCSKSAT